MSTLITQHRIAVALVGVVALFALLLALSPFAASYASGRTVASKTPLFRNSTTIASHPPLFRNRRPVAS